MDKNKIIEKIKKLLSLGNSPEQEEAEMAVMKATELAARYNIEISQMDTRQTGIEKQVTEKGPRTPFWKSFLLANLAKHNFCSLIVTRSYSNGRHVGKKLSVCGKRINIIIVKEMYEYLVNAINRLAKKNCAGLGRSYTTSYRLGIAYKIEERLMHQKQQLQKRYTGSTGLMVIETAAKKELNEYHTRNNIKGRSEYNGFDSSGGTTGFFDGIEASDTISLNTQINDNGDYPASSLSANG